MKIVIGLATIFMLTLPFAVYVAFFSTEKVAVEDNTPPKDKTLPPWSSSSTDGEANNYISNS